MDLLTIVLIILVPLNLLLTVWLLASWRKKGDDGSAAKLQADLNLLRTELVSGQMEGLVLLRDSLDKATLALNERLAEGTSSLDRRMAVIGEIENRLGQLSNQTQKIESIGNNIQSLAELLKPPKLRGNLGEQWLVNILEQILPKALFETQYRFADGQRVDAVIKMGERLLPVDSKFPLEAFQRLTDENSDDSEKKAAAKAFSQALKKHITDISSKYVRPDENTTDFAVMYLPSEAIYSRFVSGDNFDEFQFGLTKKVIPASPGILYGFLASVVAIYKEAGLTGDRRQLVNGLNSLAESLDALSRLDERLAGSLRQAGLTLEKVKEEHEKMSKQLARLQEPDAIADRTDL